MASEIATLNSQLRTLIQTIMNDKLHGKKLYLIGSAE
jgi:hypothetical protein